jgi:glycosyltransferase 2 family protein
MNLKRLLPRLSMLLGLGISLLCLVYVFSQVDLQQSWQVLLGIDQRLLLLPIGIAILELPLRPWRWWASFPSPERPRFGACFSVLGIGIMVNNFLPGRGGDVLRCFLLKRDERRLSPSLALATLGVEKILDGLALTLIIGLCFLMFDLPFWIKKLGIAAGLLFGGVWVLFLIFSRANPRLIAWVEKTLQRFKYDHLAARIAGILAQFSQGLTGITSPRRMGLLILLTLGIWLAEAALVWAQALAMDIPLSLGEATLLIVILGLGLSIPAAPASIGTYEFFAMAALKIFGIPAAPALALTLVMHSWSLVQTTAIGLLCLSANGISLGKVLSLSNRPSPSLDPEDPAAKNL